MDFNKMNIEIFEELHGPIDKQKVEIRPRELKYIIIEDSHELESAILFPE